MPTMIFSLYLPLILLVGLALVCLRLLPAQRRRGLLTMTVTVGVAAALLFLGEWILNLQGLTWRTVPKELLCTVTWLSGLTAGVLTVRYVGRCPAKGERHWARWGQTAALVCLVLVMLFGSVAGLLWAMGPGEKAGTYQGRKVVQGSWTWVGDTSYSLYEYHGPLARGRESLENSLDPFLP